MIERPTKLTHAAVVKYAAGSKRRVISDPQTQSLYLIIMPKPSATRSWLMRFRRPSGRVGKIVLGRFDASGAEPS